MKKYIVALASLCLLIGSAFASEENSKKLILIQKNEAFEVLIEAKEEGNITRENFFTLLAKACNGEGEPGCLEKFEDAGDVDEGLEKYIAYLVSNDILSGVERTGKLYIMPKNPITRQEAATIISKMFNFNNVTQKEFTDNNSIANWASQYISTAVNAGVINAYSNNMFKPNDSITVTEAKNMIDILNDKECFSERKLLQYAGNGKSTLTDGELNESAFYSPMGLLNKKGGIYIVDNKNNSIRKIEEGIVSTVAGSVIARDAYGVSIGSFSDGTKALFNAPEFIADSKKGILITDSGNNLIRHLKGAGVTTYAGNIEGGYKDGKRNRALFNNPTGIASDEKGNVYIADTDNNVIRKIDRNDNVTTFAGRYTAIGGYLDGRAKETLFNRPTGVAVKDGIVYVSDTGNQRIRKIENGIVTTIAGNGTEKYDNSNEIIGDFADGAKDIAYFNFPKNLIIDDEGNIYVSDTGNSAVRKIDTNGNVHTLIGMSDKKNENGIKLKCPSGLMIYEDKIYITDSISNVIFEY